MFRTTKWSSSVQTHPVSDQAAYIVAW